MSKSQQTVLLYWRVLGIVINMYWYTWCNSGASDVALLWCDYPNWGSSGDHEPRVQRLGECGLNSVNEHHLTRIRHAVEGQAPSLVVQIHSHCRGTGDGYSSFDFIVPKSATGTRKRNAPGLVGVAEATFFQLCSFIAQGYLNPWPFPFNLPVANTR